MMHAACEVRRCGLNQPNIAGYELLSNRRQLIESAHEFNPAMPDYGFSDDLSGSHENARGAVIDPKRIAFDAGRQRSRAKVLEQARKAKEERSLYLTRSYDPKGKGKGKDGGPDADGEKPGRGPRGDK